MLATKKQMYYIDPLDRNSKRSIFGIRECPDNSHPMITPDMAKLFETDHVQVRVKYFDEYVWVNIPRAWLPVEFLPEQA